MRKLAVIIAFAAVTAAAAAQTPPLQDPPPSTPPPSGLQDPAPATPATPAQMALTVIVETPATAVAKSDHTAPPEDFVLPDATNVEAVRAARGNATAWRDATRRRIGRYSRGFFTANPSHPLPSFGGYFAFFGNDEYPAAIVQGNFNSPGSDVGEAVRLLANPVYPAQVCGGVLHAVIVDMSELTYLGPTWRPEFDALDTAIGGTPDTRVITGPDKPVNIIPHSTTGPLDFSRYYPSRATYAEIDGAATLGCLTRADGSALCGVRSEGPLDASGVSYGWADAALRIYRQVRLADTATNQPMAAGQCMTMHLRFSVPR